MRQRRRGLTNALRLACPLVLAAGLLATGSPGDAVRIAMPGGAGGATSDGDSAAGKGALTSLTLTSVGSDGSAADAPSTQAAVAADGRYVAFQSQAALRVSASAGTGPDSPHHGSAPASRIYVHDLGAGRTTVLSDPVNGAATVPDISANGRLVSYQQGGDVYVADRQATGSGPFDTTGNLVVRQVTGISKDLGYERGVPCPAGLGAGQERVTPCGPRLSADGTTLVYPAELSPVSPQLAVTASLGGEEGSPAQGSTARNGESGSPPPEPSLSGDVVDFTPYYPGGGYGFPGGTAATVTYTNDGSTPVTFSQPVSLTEPPDFPTGQPFVLGPSTCTGALTPGSSCTVDVSFSYYGCDYAENPPQLFTGDLTTHSAAPAGQSVLELTALCNQYDEGESSMTPAGRGRAGPAQAHCRTPPPGLTLTAAAATTTDDQGAPLTNAGSAEIGRPYVVWVPVQVPANSGGTASVVFEGANDDCGIQLVDPASLKLADPLPATAPPACAQGEQLGNPSPPPSSPPPSSPPSTSAGTRQSADGATDPPASCTAYLLVSPGSVAPDSAFLGTESDDYYGYGSLTPTTYLTMWGVRHLIVARHDATGSGNFAASPSTVVSVTGSGAGLPDASEPSVSADGRYVGFAAPAPVGSSGQQAAAGATEVWLHDTDKTGNGSYQPGATTMVSCLPRARAGPCQPAPNADSPSVSGDGQQAAFATTAAISAHNGYPGTGTDADGVQAAGPISADQVYLRSVAAGSTVLISAPCRIKNRAANGKHDNGGTACSQPAAGGDGASYAPVITQDSSTVGYVSQATDLTGTRVAAGPANLYLRPASAAATASELVSASGASLPAGTAVGLPGIDAHGRLVTFPATGALTAGAPPGVASVYTFDRRPSLSSSPTAAGFGRVLIDSGTHSLPLDVTDSGPGPGTVTGVGVTGPFHLSADRCTGVTLYQGSRCAVTITFTPVASGAAAGALTVTTQDDDEPPVNASVAATAAVPAPRLTVTPGVASAGEASQVVGISFPPDQTVTLTWSLGLGSGSAVTSGAGGFSAAMVIFPNDFVGPRTLIASGTAGQLATAPFLVQDGPVEPPFSQQVP